MFHVRATRDFRWLVARTGSYLSENARAIECVDEPSGRIVGMIVYDQWTQNACTAHIALDVPAALRRLRRPGFEYPFVEANRGVLLVGVSSLNSRSLRLVESLGFQKLCQIRDAMSVGVDNVLFEMRRENCRHLKE